MTAAEETVRCPKCGFKNDPISRMCGAAACRTELKTDLECLRSIDLSAKSIRLMMIWWWIVAIVGAVMLILAEALR